MTRLSNAVKQRDAAREDALLAAEKLNKLQEDLDAGLLQPAAGPPAAPSAAAATAGAHAGQSMGPSAALAGPGAASPGLPLTPPPYAGAGAEPGELSL